MPPPLSLTLNARLTGLLKTLPAHVPPLHEIEVAGGGCWGPSASARRTVLTTVPCPARAASQSMNAAKSGALTESSLQPSQMSWKMIGSHPVPELSACVTQLSRLASEIGPVGSG